MSVGGVLLRPDRLETVSDGAVILSVTSKGEGWADDAERGLALQQAWTASTSAGVDGVVLVADLPTFNRSRLRGSAGGRELDLSREITLAGLPTEVTRLPQSLALFGDELRSIDGPILSITISSTHTAASAVEDGHATELFPGSLGGLYLGDVDGPMLHDELASALESDPFGQPRIDAASEALFTVIKGLETGHIVLRVVSLTPACVLIQCDERSFADGIARQLGRRVGYPVLASRETALGHVQRLTSERSWQDLGASLRRAYEAA